MTRYAGDLVVLRAREPDDAGPLTAWYADPETMRWWDSVYPPMPVEAFAARIANAPPPSFHQVSFTVLDRASGVPIGWCGMFHQSAEHRSAEIGVLVGDPAYRGRGYGTDLTRTLCRFGFGRMNLVRISLTVFPENTAARRAYARVGFAEEGAQRRAMWRHGEWHDLLHLAVFPETLR